MNLNDKIKKLIENGEEVLKSRYSSLLTRTHTLECVNDALFSPWKNRIESFVAKEFGKDSEEYKFFTQKQDIRNKYSVAEQYQLRLQQLLEDIKSGFIENNYKDNKLDTITALQNIFLKFPLVAKQLESRHQRRESLIIKDEYDVQDLLHSLLKLYFDDIRPEECCPSYAGTKARTDFLLKDEEIFIEVKKTNQNLKDKQIGEQLTIDKNVYSSHPNCKMLVCFIYDPDRYIENKNAIIKDIEKTKDLPVRVFIYS